ncbi:MAG: glycosyltransferase family 4 protein [Cetobacterium sp.]|uniref:glycosyltransferase family 4 protein n=1 Tax=Cetobacterium sp. TaxID=2071632 RepID=UPI003F2FD94D
MKKFLIVTTIQDTVEAFLIPHIKMLEAEGYKVSIATNIYKEISEELKNNEWVNISFSRNPFCLNSFKAVKEMRALIRSGKFEMVHFHTPVAAFLGRYAAMREKQKNIIYTAHGFHFYEGASLINWCIYYPMELLAARWTDKLITINEEDYRKSLEFKLRKNGRCYKVNGVGVDSAHYSSGDAEKIKKELLIRDPEKTVLMIGELNKNKNQAQLIKALELLRLKGRNIKAIFVGIGEQEGILKKMAKELGVKVAFLGYRKDIKDIIDAADIVVSMSYREGLPRNIMEAMSAGKPLVVTDIRGNRDIVTQEENGLLVALNDIDATASALESLLYNPKLYKKISENNYKKIESYSIVSILESMKEVYGFEKVSDSQS